MLRLRDKKIEVAVRVVVSRRHAAITDLRRCAVQARGRSFIRFNLAPAKAPRLDEYYVFINDEAEQNEECLMLKVSYQ